MLDYFTIIRDYFYDYFTIIFPIITDYSDYFYDYFRLFQGVGTRKMGMCRQQFLTQSRRNDGLASMKNACSSASTGRRSDRMENCLMERSCTIIRIIFSIMRIILLG